jgi:hypothetical protein
VQKLLSDKAVTEKYAKSRRGVFDKEHAVEQQKVLVCTALLTNM